jgi:hypothetical protein
MEERDLRLPAANLDDKIAENSHGLIGPSTHSALRLAMGHIFDERGLRWPPLAAQID